MLEITRNGKIINNKYFKSNDYFVHIDGKRFDQLSPILFSSPFLQKKKILIFRLIRIEFHSREQR